ncbi:MAG: carbohydrate kinase [Acidiphilium sp.]|nr:carbohydrate kinase [Acidiphilium sp.]
MTGRPLILAIDAGTSMLKAVAFDTDGRLIDSKSRPNVHHESAGGRAEQDMGATWSHIAAIISALTARHESAAILALAVTGQGDGTWLIDAEGNPVGPAILWLDGRAGPLVDAFRATDAARTHFEQTNTGLAACHQSSQILWLAQHQPDRLAAAATALHCKDYLYFRLTGERATDPSEGGFTYGSWRTRAYSDATIAALGLQSHRRLLPPIVDGSRTAHPLTAAAAAQLGLQAGTTVVLGFIDTVCSGLGAGLLATGAEGTAGTSILGSTGINMRLAPDEFELPADAPMSGFRVACPAPGRTVLMQSMLAATLNIDWLVGLAGHAVRLAGHSSEPDAMRHALDATVLEAPPARAMFHPYIAAAGERGPFTDATARASLAGISRSLDLPGVMRSIYEGIALAAADCYDAMGSKPDIITLTGGAARSTAMRHIFAATLNRPVRIVREHGGAALGAAMIAAVSCGIASSMEACAAAWVTPLLGTPEPPDAGLAARYAGLLGIYQQSRRSMAGEARSSFWHQFAAVQEPGQ